MKNQGPVLFDIMAREGISSDKLLTYDELTRPTDREMSAGGYGWSPDGKNGKPALVHHRVTGDPTVDKALVSRIRTAVASGVSRADIMETEDIDVFTLNRLAGGAR